MIDAAITTQTCGMGMPDTSTGVELCVAVRILVLALMHPMMG